MSTIIADIDKAGMRSDMPEFSAGDTVVVWVKVKEGSRERLQAFEGVVIAVKNRGINSSFTVRKISHGEGVERVFQTHSPLVDRVEVKRYGRVRKARLYYLRDRRGRSARITENLSKAKKMQQAAKAAAAQAAAAPAPAAPAAPEADAASAAEE